MGGSYFGNAGIFLVNTAFSIYILIVMLRWLLQLVRADFYNPISQFIVKATSPPLRPLRRVLPGFMGVDTASIVLMFALKFIELWLVQQIGGGPTTGPGLAVLSVAGLLGLVVQVFMFSIIIQIIVSWISPGAHNPVLGLLRTLTDPLMRPARRIIPPTGGLDLSPMLVLVALTLVLILAVAPISDWGNHLLYRG